MVDSNKSRAARRLRDPSWVAPSGRRAKVQQVEGGSGGSSSGSSGNPGEVKPQLVAEGGGDSVEKPVARKKEAPLAQQAVSKNKKEAAGEAVVETRSVGVQTELVAGGGVGAWLKDALGRLWGQ